MNIAAREKMRSDEGASFSRWENRIAIPDPWLFVAFLVFLASLGGAAALVLWDDGQGWVLPLAIIAGAVFLACERWGANQGLGGLPEWRGLKGSALAVLLVAVVLFAANFPTLSFSFNGDDFAYLHFFQSFSWTQFLQLFHTDIAKILWAQPRQELRPFYGLYYMLSYPVWGLHAWGYHVTNLLMQVANSFLVFLIVREHGGNHFWRATTAAALFCVLPLQSEVFFWATGAPTELIPGFFYLAAFLCFIRFRSTGSVPYLAISMLAFAADLASKESAVTLPVMFLAYEFFRKRPAASHMVPREKTRNKTRAGSLLLYWVSFAVLFAAYLKLRHVASGDYLRVSKWGNIREALSSSAGFWRHLYNFTEHWGEIQEFNFHHLLMPYPGWVIGIVFGFYLSWAWVLLKDRSECRQPVASVLYFGGVWYLIAIVPLMVVDTGVWHLYIPAIGPCIAVSFLAFPECDEPQKMPARFRLMGAGLLVVLSAVQLWQANLKSEYRITSSTKMITGMRAAIASAPKDVMILVWPRETFWALDESLPYAIQPPFTSTDLYSDYRLIPDPYLYGKDISVWWARTAQVLAAESAGNPEDEVAMRLIRWDVKSHSVQQTEIRFPRRNLQACVEDSSTGKVGLPDGFTSEQQADVLMKDLADLRTNPRCPAGLLTNK